MSTQLMIIGADALVLKSRVTANTSTDTLKRKTLKDFATESGKTVKEIRASGSYITYLKKFSGVQSVASEYARENGLEFHAVSVKKNKDGIVTGLDVQMRQPVRESKAQKDAREVEELRAKLSAKIKEIEDLKAAAEAIEIGDAIEA